MYAAVVNINTPAKSAFQPHIDQGLDTRQMKRAVAIKVEAKQSMESMNRIEAYSNRPAPHCRLVTTWLNSTKRRQALRQLVKPRAES